MIAVIDYKMGNLRSVAKAFEIVGAKVKVTNKPANLRKAKALILPGVGAFSAGMSHLRKMNLIPEIYEAVKEQKPFLGICLGLQLLFAGSEEHGRHLGLNVIPGRVVRFKSDLKIPHMGWNTITKVKSVKLKVQSELLKSVPENSYFYFVHSYYVKPKEKDIMLATTEYGQEFASIVARDNIYGIQFHPEKSSDLGLKILENFCRIVGEIN